ncbi:MAG TPA: hypothetical protein VK399_14235 [Longimicrobiaceae bacterium]|nr:hypothetical protein [Longimicrobiaceae bacterium]
MLPPAEAKQVHARWSPVNREFLEFVERHPAYLSRASFASLGEDPAYRKFPLQPWPLFIGPEQRREMEEVVLGIDRLVKSTLARFLRGDPARVIEYFRSVALDELDQSEFIALQLSEELLGLLLQEPTGIEGALSRADYIETADGLKCIEFNAGSYLGGLSAHGVGELYRASPAIGRFLAGQGRRTREPRTLRALFRHLLEDTARMGAWKEGEFNVAVLARPHEEDQVALHDPELYQRQMDAALADDGRSPGGRVLLCATDDLVDDGGVLTAFGHPVHAVVEQNDGSGDMRMVFWFFKQGRVNLFSGPITALLLDKRNLAMISENAESDEYTVAERALIARHVPWTRRLLPAETAFRGSTLRIPEDVLERRGEFVLKKATSLGGSQVHVGRFRGDDEWRAVVERALRENDWVVQEYLETVPYWLQSGESGVAPYDVIWGLFAFGDHFGGALMRMQPQGGGHGVVNTRQGAQVGALLELAD